MLSPFVIAVHSRDLDPDQSELRRKGSGLLRLFNEKEEVE